MLLAMLERIAADFYRSWAEDSEDPVERDGLRACAAIEEEIAAFAESLEPDAEGKRKKLSRRFPELREAYASAFAGRSRRDQLRLQADGESGGVEVLQKLAAAATGAAAARYAALALLEESNAVFLRSLLCEK